MRAFRLIFLVFLVAAISAVNGYSQNRNRDWLPLSDQERNFKEVPGIPGASAVMLYYAQDIDDYDLNNNAEYVYTRIKVLDEKGKKYADVEIPEIRGRVQELKARTIHPDGKTIDFLDKPYTKLIVKGRGFKFNAKAFTLPDVTVGSIIEYRYKLDYPPNLLPHHEWEVQHDLFTVKEYFKIRAFTGEIVGAEGGTGISLSGNLPPGMKPQRVTDGFTLQTENIPPFDEEPNMPPREAFSYHVTFFYGGREILTADGFWQYHALKWNKAVEEFIGNSKEVRQAASTAVGSETDPEKKLRAIYASARRIRNLTYERSRNEEEQKREKLRPNRTAAETLSHQYGYRDDITRTFIGMARAAGISAMPIRVTDRSQQFFDKNTLIADQFETEIAEVELNGKQVLLDPGTRFCPYGLLRWNRTSTKAMRITPKGGMFFDTPGAPADQAVIQRSATVAVQENGSVKGEMKLTFMGSEALERRLDALDTDSAGFNKHLEDQVREWLPNGSVAKVANVAGVEGSEEPLTATLTVEVPSYASIAGKRMLVPASLFTGKQKQAFQSSLRKFPVYFPYAYSELDELKLNIPASYKLETAPSNSDVGVGYAIYHNEVSVSGNELSARRELRINGIFFRVDQYKELRDFFGKVVAGDEQQAVLQEGSLSAQSGK